MILARMMTTLLLGSAFATLCAAQNPLRLDWIRGGTPLGVNHLVYSPDGELFASAGDDDSVKVFRTADANLVFTFAGNGAYASTVAFSPDGTLLASAGLDQTIKLWDVSTGQLVRSFQGDAILVYALAFSPNGKWLASGGYDHQVKIWDPGTGTLVRTLTGHTDIVYDVAFSPNGLLLASGSDDETLRVWDPATGANLYTVVAHDWYVIDVDFSPSGLAIATTGGLDHPRLKLWNAVNGSLIRSINVDPFSISQCEWAPDESSIITSGRYGLKVWNPATGALLRSEPNGDYALAISPDGTQILNTGSGQIGSVESESVYQRRYADLSLIREASSHTSAVTCLAYAPDGLTLASGCYYFESAARLWDAAAGEEVARFYYTNVGDGVVDVEFTEDGRRVALSGGDGDAKLFDVASGALVQTYEHGDTGPLTVYAVAFHPNGRRVYTGGSDGNVKMWRLGDGELLATFFAGYDPYDLKFSPDRSVLAVATNGGIALLDPDDGHVVRMITGHAALVSAIEFTPSGKFIASASHDGTCALFEVATGARVRQFLGHSGKVRDMDLAPNGELLISCADDDTLRIWQVETGRELARYHDESSFGVRAVAFGRDGRTFAFGRSDGTVATGTFLGGCMEVGAMTAPR